MVQDMHKTLGIIMAEDVSSLRTNSIAQVAEIQLFLVMTMW